MKKPQFVESHIYHVYNRGVEKRDIFLDDHDRFRFVHDLFEFNDAGSVSNTAYHLDPDLGTTEKKARRQRQRKLLVEILLFTLMPNHFHLLLRQKRDGGIVKFMQKLGTGYTNYFNKKYERVGALFQGRFKAVLVSDEAHFIHLPFYIHTNPLDLINESSPQVDRSEFLENYRWSSYLDYIGKKNFPSVTSRKFLLNFFDGEEAYKENTIRWIKSKEENMDKIQGVALE